eukprot:scaffold28822_cov36-Phaeocystis_antarctica.AAC.1
MAAAERLERAAMTAEARLGPSPPAHIRLQAPSHTVAGSITYGCRRARRTGSPRKTRRRRQHPNPNPNPDPKPQTLP